jgi:hypothetical protein
MKTTKMKFLLTITLYFLALSLYAQYDNNSHYYVKLKNGVVFNAQVNKTSKNKIFFKNCNDLKHANKTIKRKDIDTIHVLSLENPQQFINRKDSIPVIQLTRIDNESKVKTIKENKFLHIKTTDSLSLKGKVIVVNKDTIQINEKILPIEKIRLIKKPVLSAIIFGNTFGYMFTVLSVGLLESQGVEEGLTVAPLALPFYSMNFIRRRFNLETNWKAEIIFKKKNDRKKVFDLN